jgi:hypothetical protein
MRSLTTVLNEVAARIRQLEAIQIPAAGAGAPHDILSATHLDSTPAVVSRGSLIYGDATPTWNELVLGGIAGSLLTRNTTDALWTVGALVNRWDAVDGAARIVIPGGAADIVYVGAFLYTVYAITAMDVRAGVATITPGAAQILYTDDTSTLTLACSVGGELTVQRTAGTDTFNVTLMGVWQ